MQVSGARTLQRLVGDYDVTSYSSTGSTTPDSSPF